MLRAFNAFQLVGVFSGLPYLIGWLASNPFAYSVAAYWTAIVVYAVAFIGLVVVTADYFAKDR